MGRRPTSNNGATCAGKTKPGTEFPGSAGSVTNRDELPDASNAIR